MTAALAPAVRQPRNAGRWLVSGALTAGAVVLFVTWNSIIRAEALFTAYVLRFVYGPGTGAAGDTVWTGIGSPELFGMRLTVLCSTYVLLIPLLLLGATMALWLRRAPLWRVLLGCAASLVVAIAANQIRFVMLVALWRGAGQAGFDLGHRYIGSLEVIALFALAMFVAVRVAAGPRKGRPRGGKHATPRASRSESSR